MNKFLIYILIFLYLYLFDRAFFLHMQEKYCKKYKGVCKNCDCWSCTRKKYIDEYKNGG